MNTFIPGCVYENLIKMIRYRGATCDDDQLDATTLAQKLNHHEYVVIAATRGHIVDEREDPRLPAQLSVVLIAPDSKYATKSAEFVKLLKMIPADTATMLDVIYISELPLTNHIIKQLAKFRPTRPRARIEDHTYKKFMIEAPAHVLVPKHTIATPAEVREYCAYFRTQEDKFQKILQSDTQAVWIGLRAGMVVKIMRASETAGYNISYRYCIKS